MNNARSLAKITFVALAIYFLIGLARNLTFATNTINYSIKNLDTKFILTLVLFITIPLLYIVALIYFLIYKRDKWAQKLFPDDTEPAQTPTSGINLTSAYRLICFSAGLGCTYYFFNSLLPTFFRLGYLQAARTNSPSVLTYFNIYFKPLFPSFIMLLLGIYLLCGAPHFVRWQVKKTLELYSRNDSNCTEESP